MINPSVCVPLMDMVSAADTLNTRVHETIYLFIYLFQTIQTQARDIEAYNYEIYNIGQNLSATTSQH